MLRSTTLLCIAAAGGISLGLFAVSYQVRDLEDEIARIDRAIAGERKAIHVLKAEWAHLNDMLRLRELADKHLDLQPVAPDQLGRFADLPIRHAAAETAPDVMSDAEFAAEIAATLKAARRDR